MSMDNFSSSVPMIKLEDFTVSVYNAWRRNTQFGMQYLNIFYTVQTDFKICPEVVGEFQWIKDEDFCRDYLINCLCDRLAENYSQLTTAKEIYDALDTHYNKEEELSETHLVDKIMAFTFDENKLILPQVKETVTTVGGYQLEVHLTGTADLILSSASGHEKGGEEKLDMDLDENDLLFA